MDLWEVAIKSIWTPLCSLKTTLRRSSITWQAVILALALILMAAGGPTARAASEETGTTTVTFSIAEAIEVTSWPPANFVLATDATPGVPVVSEFLSITVKSNAAWGLQISSDSSDGTLREYDNATRDYVVDGAKVGPVEWATNTGGPWTPISATPSTIFSNQPPTGEDAVARGFILRVTPDFDATSLPPGREYRIVLTYTAGVGY